MEKIKITGDEPATGFGIAGDHTIGWRPESVTGMTIRQQLIMAAMQGLCVGKTTSNILAGECVDIANCAVEIADQTIIAINKV